MICRSAHAFNIADEMQQAGRGKVGVTCVCGTSWSSCVLCWPGLLTLRTLAMQLPAKLLLRPVKALWVAQSYSS